MSATLHTDRLTLRPLTPDDAPGLFEIYRDARAMHFMPTPPHTDSAETRAMIERDTSYDGAVHWAVRRQGDDRIIGQVNYLGGTRIPGMGYILHPDFWGQGLTIEACRAALDYGFTQLGHDRVELWIDETNAASLRVAQKLGFNIVGRIAHKYRHKDTHHFMLVWGLRVGEEADKSPAAAAPMFFAAEPVLHVHDVALTTDFYRDKLGFHIDFLYGDPPEHAGVSCGEWTGSLVSIQLSQIPPEREIKPAGYLHIRVSDVDSLCRTYRAAGVNILSEPDDRPWGMREFAIKDLDGHVFAALL